MSVATRRRLNMIRIALRTPSAESRLLPDFMVIGTQRGGTSSLFKYLSFHPEITPSVRKEIEYFSRFRGDHRIGWYRAHFPLASARRRAESQGAKLLTFEATPVYLDHPHTPSQVAELTPDLKIIVLLRNPVARALSHHQHMSRLKLEKIPFPQAVRFEEERIRNEKAKVFADPLYYSRPYTRLCYAYRGFYAEHLSRWFECFPRERFIFIRSEDFFSDPSTALGKVLNFLEVDSSWRPEEFSNFSYRGHAAPQYEDMDPATRTLLEEKFAPHNQRLVEMLGPDFMW